MNLTNESLAMMTPRASVPLWVRLALALLLLLTVLLVSGCGAFEIGIEHVPPGATGGEAAVAEVNWQATAETLLAQVTQANDNNRHNNNQDSSPLFVPTPVPVMEPAFVPTLAPLRIAWASDRASVAYVQEGDIWAMILPDWARFLQRGEELRLTEDGNNGRPMWSASGQWLSFVKGEDDPALWVMRHDGRAAQRIGAAHQAEAYAWSPTEDRLAVGEGGSVRFYDFSSGAPLLMNQVDLIPADESVNGNAYIGEVVWNPNGQQFAFTLWSAGEQDGIWVLTLMEGEPKRILPSEVPEKGQFVLRGWSGDGKGLLYLQSPVLSAAALVDGVPLYYLPVSGGTPYELSDDVPMHRDSVQSQPQGLPLITFVEGYGREMWQNKRLRATVPGEGRHWVLMYPDQAASSPVWSPDGNTLAYIGMPEITGVSGGETARNALRGRQLWIRDPDEEHSEMVQNLGPARVDAVQWIDNQTLLVATFEYPGGVGSGRYNLTVVDIAGSQSQGIRGGISPAPDWFGFYGHIDWSDYFSVWRPSAMADPMAQPTAVPVPTLVPFEPQPTPYGGDTRHTLLGFLQTLHPAMTLEQANALYGPPDAVVNSGQTILQYNIGGGVWLWLAFPPNGPLTYAALHAISGHVFDLSFTAGIPAPIYPLSTPTPIPSAMDAPTALPPTAVPDVGPTATATPLVANPDIATPVPRASMTPTPTPAAMDEATATPLPALPAELTPVPPTVADPTATPVSQ